MIKKDHSVINRVLNKFCDASHRKYGDYAYACGAMQARLAWLVANELPAHKQNEFLKSIEAFIEEELIEKTTN